MGGAVFAFEQRESRGQVRQHGQCTGGTQSFGLAQVLDARVPAIAGPEIISDHVSPVVDGKKHAGDSAARKRPQYGLEDRSAPDLDHRLRNLLSDWSQARAKSSRHDDRPVIARLRAGGSVDDPYELTGGVDDRQMTDASFVELPQPIDERYLGPHTELAPVDHHSACMAVAMKFSRTMSTLQE